MGDLYTAQLAEQLRRLARRLDALADRVEADGGQDGATVAAWACEVQGQGDALADLAGDAVTVARVRGASWTAVGRAFGVSKQAAARRWGESDVCACGAVLSPRALRRNGPDEWACRSCGRPARRWRDARRSGPAGPTRQAPGTP